MWYYQIYGNVNFIPAITEIKPSSASIQYMDFIQSTKKKQQNWSLSNLLFCSEILCDQVFENVKDLETHLIKGCEKTVDSDGPRSSMDNVKSLFPSKMVFSSHIHVTLSNNHVCLAETSINEACKRNPLLRMFQEHPLLRMFQETDWAIPQRKVFK